MNAPLLEDASLVVNLLLVWLILGAGSVASTELWKRLTRLVFAIRGKDLGWSDATAKKSPEKVTRMRPRWVSFIWPLVAIVQPTVVGWLWQGWPVGSIAGGVGGITGTVIIGWLLGNLKKAKISVPGVGGGE
jgi:hypothetical protein